jgi:hypothetical protein
MLFPLFMLLLAPLLLQVLLILLLALAVTGVHAFVFTFPNARKFWSLEPGQVLSRGHTFMEWRNAVLWIWIRDPVPF